MSAAVWSLCGKGCWVGVGARESTSWSMWGAEVCAGLDVSGCLEEFSGLQVLLGLRCREKGGVCQLDRRSAEVPRRSAV